LRPSFLRVATKPKWIGALVLALAAAALFAALGQWQLSRSIRVTTEPTTVDVVTPLTDITSHGQPFMTNQADRRVSLTVRLKTENCFVISNRRQLQADDNTQSGFWVMTDSIDTLGAHLFLAHGFTPNAASANLACVGLMAHSADTDKAFMLIAGRYEPSEEALKQIGGANITTGDQAKIWGSTNAFDSVAVPQLINVASEKPIATYAGFVIMESSGASALIEPIKIGIKKTDSQLSLLNAFYFIEWTLFAGFAVFLWWRLVQDERDRAARDEASEVSTDSGI
jgi:surfeit locus 1 family protein